MCNFGSLYSLDDGQLALEMHFYHQKETKLDVKRSIQFPGRLCIAPKAIHQDQLPLTLYAEHNPRIAKSHSWKARLFCLAPHRSMLRPV